MRLEAALPDLENRTGGCNLPGRPICARPGHVDLAHHWGIRLLCLRNAPGQTLYEEYHPYGTSAYRSFGSADVSAKRYRYTGKERDEETGLYYHGARYYMCWLARWASADPLGVGADGPGLYTYVRGSPVVLSDPSGMWPFPSGKDISDAYERVKKGARKVSDVSEQLAEGVGRWHDQRLSNLREMFSPAMPSLVIHPSTITQAQKRAALPPVRAYDAALRSVKSYHEGDYATAMEQFLHSRDAVHETAGTAVSPFLGGGGSMKSAPRVRLPPKAVPKLVQKSSVKHPAPSRPGPARRQVDTSAGMDTGETPETAFRMPQQPRRAAPGAKPDTKGRALGPGDEFSAHISDDAGVLASLGDDGFLDLYIKAGPDTPRGGQMFNQAMEAFGQNVKGIRGTWIGGGELADNFDAFKAALKTNSPQEAAFQTFTGHMARKHGFTNVRIVRNDANRVVVEFFK